MKPARAIAALLACAASLCAITSAAANGVDPTRLSLPKGPGSIEGLGKNFEPSPASGTASYGVDIATPPSVAGFAPKIALEYDGGGGVSELGSGWRLGGIPALRRRVADGLPRFDASDHFELTGIGGGAELVEVEPEVFRSRFETGAFVRVVRSGDRWEARGKDGITYRFGDGVEEAEDGHVATYLLYEQVDLHGHRISYEWDTSDGKALLERVIWNDLSDAARAEISLEYEARPDVHETFASGIRQRITKRLVRIEVSRGGSLFRRYELGYRAGSRSLLESVAVVGADEATSLPEVRFDYTELASDPTVVQMQSSPGRSPAESDVALADLNGDSLPDLLVGTAGAYRSYVNDDGESWQPGEDWTTSSSPSVSLGTTGVGLADLDADGAIDLVIKSGLTDFRYLPAVTATGFGASVSIATVPSFTFEDPDVRLADVDSDGRIDVLVTTLAGLALGYNLGGRDFTEPAIVGSVDPIERVRFSEGAELCDVNGDRIQDFCKLRAGSLVYWLGRGRGLFELARTGTGVPDFELTEPFRLLDLDGDGWPDLVRVGVTGLDYALAVGAGEFGELERIDGTPEKTAATAIEFADMNGSGTTDVVWVDVTTSAGWQYLELFPQGRGGLLKSIDNGLGKKTTIDYGTAAAHAARARAEGQPWTSRLNAGLPVVERITIDGSLGDPLQVTELSYRDGTWDPIEHTFAGFASANLRELGDDYTPTRSTDYTYDVGVVHRALRGLTLTSEERDGETLKTLRRTTNGYTIIEIAASASEYGYKSSERIEHAEGRAASEMRTVLTEWEQDTHGNVTAELRWGEVVGDDKLAGGDEALTHRTFAESADDWLLGHVASEELTDATGARIALKRFYYDGEPFAGLSLGEVTRGDLTRTESWIEDDRFADEERSERDQHGNVVAAFDVRGAKSEVDYDLDSSTFVVAERHFVDDNRAISWGAEYDPVLGVVTEAMGPNGETYSFRYDGLGRARLIVQPADTLEHPTREFVYELGSPLSIVRTLELEHAGTSDTIERLAFYDGLGRLRGRIEEGSLNGQWVAKDLARFDARGNAAVTSHPSFETEQTLPLAEDRPGPTTRRDALGRVVGVEQVDGASTLTVYVPLGREQWDENDRDPSSPHHDTPTRYFEDGLGRLRRVVELDGAREVTSAVYDYDAAGKLLGVTDAAEHLRSYERDGRGRQRRIIDANAGTWDLTYSDGNDLESRSDASGNRVRFVYDALGRQVEEWQRLGQDGEERRTVSRHYDEASPEHPEATNLVGQLAWVEDEAGSVFFGYSPRGLETEKIRRFLEGNEFRVTSTYDSADRRVTRGFPDGSTLEQRYDSRGLLNALGPVVTSIEWTAWGRPAALELGNGVLDTHHHDERMRLVRLEAQNGDGAALRDLTYTLDAHSRISAVEDLRPSLAAEESLTTSYGYDDRYRLRTATDSAGETSWEVDDVGNISSISSAYPLPELNVTNRFGEDGQGADRLTHFGDEPIAYYASGQVESDGERTYYWDAKGRLVRVVRGSTTEEYTYGYDDVRAVKRTKAGNQTSEIRYIDADAEIRHGKLVRYVPFDGARVARLDPLDGESTASAPTPARSNPRDASDIAFWALLATGLAFALRRTPSTAVRRLRPAFAAVALSIAVLPMMSCDSDEPAPKAAPKGGGPIATLPEPAVFYFTDLAGTIVSTADARGELRGSTARFPYGAVRHTTGATEPFGFIGHEEDASGLVDLGARPYRAAAAAFLAVDPVALLQADQLIGKPAKLPPYAYASCDPTNFVDPTGRSPQSMQNDPMIRELQRLQREPEGAQLAPSPGQLQGPPREIVPKTRYGRDLVSGSNPTRVYQYYKKEGLDSSPVTTTLDHKFESSRQLSDGRIKVHLNEGEGVDIILPAGTEDKYARDYAYRGGVLNSVLERRSLSYRMTHMPGASSKASSVARFVSGYIWSKIKTETEAPEPEGFNAFTGVRN